MLAVLASLDFLIVSAAFLGYPSLGEIVLLVLAVLLGLGVVAGLPWLVLLCQNVFLVGVTTYSAFRPPLSFGMDVLHVAAILIVCSLIAWPAAWVAAPRTCRPSRGPLPRPACGIASE